MAEYGNDSNEQSGGWGEDTGRSDFQTLVGHALVDADFRNQLTDTNSRAQAVRSITGKEMTPELSAAIDEALAAINNLAATFGDYKAST